MTAEHQAAADDAAPEGVGGGLLGRLAGAAAHVLAPRNLLGFTVEALWQSVHLALYPWGLLGDGRSPAEPYDLADLAPHQRGLILGDVEAAGTPILMIHGIADNRAVFTVLRHRLRARGFGKLFAINYNPATNDVRAAARDLSAAVEELVVATGYERVHIVGHSLGGLIARYYVQRLGGDERVHTLVTLGTPHAGTWWAHTVPTRIGQQLRPGSDLYAELGEPAAACRTRFLSYWSDLDQVVLPQVSGRLEHPDLRVHNVGLRGVGHLSLPIHPPVVRQIADLLSQLDQDGHAVVTPIARPA